MSKKVYLLIAVEYSDRHIIGIFSSKEKSKDYSKVFPRWNFEIVEYTIDELYQKIIKAIKNKYKLFTVYMHRDGTIDDVEQEDFFYNSCTELTLVYSYVKQEMMLLLKVVCLAKNEKHAVRIANEKRVQLIANGEWKAS